MNIKKEIEAIKKSGLWDRQELQRITCTIDEFLRGDYGCIIGFVWETNPFIASTGGVANSS